MAVKHKKKKKSRALSGLLGLVSVAAESRRSGQLRLRSSVWPWSLPTFNTGCGYDNQKKNPTLVRGVPAGFRRVSA